MNPSRYQLPQYVSEDRQRARAHTLLRERARFEFKPDAPEDPAADDFRLLPPSCARIPKDVDFPGSMLSALGLDRLKSFTIYGTAYLSNPFARLNHERGYRNLFRLMRGPASTVARWKDDADFGRQRMTGVNPMHLRVCRDTPSAPLCDAAAKVILAQQEETGRAKLTLDEALHKGRLFSTEYSVLADPRVQKNLRPPPAGSPRTHLATPTCLFWSDDFGNLLPLAIQLKPPGVTEKNPVLTPLHPFADWMMARAHAQAADAHVHEASYHLLETHLVSGAVAICLHRELHPDHPLRQLLEPHYEYNLAINEMALGDLLAKDGTIDTALAAGVQGAMNAARMHYATWSWPARTLAADLAARGVGDPATLPQYYYRDDGWVLHDAIGRYVTAILELWYRHDGDVVQDYELQRFVAAVADPAGAAIPGFPGAIHTRTALAGLATELVFRAGPQHAAVNNGQFDAYGWIPGTPGVIAADLPETEPGPAGHFTESQLWEAMPRLGCSLAQMGMVWVLSRPTTRTLLHAGESPAFSPELCFQADEIIGAFRRRLRVISDNIQSRNSRLQEPYRYLDPLNVSRSTDI